MTSVEPPSGNERAYLEAYREASAMPDAARERVWARLSGGPLGPVGGEAANDPGIHEVVSGGGGWLARPGLWIAAAVAVVTGATVLGLLARDRPDLRSSSSSDEVELVVADRKAPRVAMPVPTGSDFAVEDVEVVVAERSVEPSAPAPEPISKPRVSRVRSKAAPNHPKPKPKPEPRPSSLADERRLIEQTHAALGRGETELARSLLRQHSRDYATGIFVEEREALLVIATCTAGQLDSGRAAANEFLASYPNAVLATRVRNRCELEE